MSKTALTYCRICEAACGLALEFDEAGNPVRLRPDKAHPISQGFACAKGTRFLDTARHPERLLHPMRRSADGALAKVGWDVALTQAGKKLRTIVDTHGPHSVGFYFGNPAAFNAVGSMALLGFTKALGTRNVYSAGSQDCNNKFAVAQLLHGAPVIHPLPDLEHAELAVLFGTNPAVSQASFMHLAGGSGLFDKLVDKGTQIVWVDPRRTESAKRWGEHLAIRPGTDAYLLLALLHELRDMPYDREHASGLERVLAHAAAYPAARAAKLTGIPEEEIVRLAARIRASRATTFHLSVGVNQSGFGSLAYALVQALTYVSGNYDRRGGVLVHPLSLPFADGARRLALGTRTVYSRIGNYPSVLDTMPGGILADEILEPGAEQIRALVVLAGDPMRTMPDPERLRKALRSLECLIVIDLFESETGKEAHYLLPATSWLERFDVATTTTLFQHSSLLQAAGAVLPAPGETRHEARILADLAHAMGGKMRNLMRPVGWAARMEASRAFDVFAKLAGFAGKPFGGRSEYGFAVPTPKPGKYLGRGPRTADKKIQFGDPAFEPEYLRLAKQSERALAADEFVLLGRRRRLGHNGWLQGAGHDGDPEAVAWVSAQDAAALGLTDGKGVVRISNENGELLIDAVVNDGVARGTVVVPHGIPDKNFNVLVSTNPAAIDRLSGMHKMTGIPVFVHAAAPI